MTVNIIVIYCSRSDNCCGSTWWWSRRRFHRCWSEMCGALFKSFLRFFPGGLLVFAGFCVLTCDVQSGNDDTFVPHRETMGTSMPGKKYHSTIGGREIHTTFPLYGILFIRQLSSRPKCAKKRWRCRVCHLYIPPSPRFVNVLLERTFFHTASRIMWYRSLVILSLFFFTPTTKETSFNTNLTSTNTVHNLQKWT